MVRRREKQEKNREQIGRGEQLAQRIHPGK